ncbi:3-dehydroquinate dehydratase [Colletotrichum asianum]
MAKGIVMSVPRARRTDEPSGFSQLRSLSPVQGRKERAVFQQTAPRDRRAEVPAEERGFAVQKLVVALGRKEDVWRHAKIDTVGVDDHNDLLIP